MSSPRGKGDHVLIEERVAGLDAVGHGQFIRWKVHGFAEDKYLLRQAAARILPAEIAQRRKAMFRAPLAESFLAHPPSFVRDLISPQSLARPRYFDAGAVRRDCEALAKGEGKLGTFTSLGLGGVVATQLWHHLYLGGGLCELPPLEFPHAAEPVAAAQPAPLAVA